MEINQAAWFHIKIALAVWLAGYGKDPQVLHIETICNHITRLLSAIRLKPKDTCGLFWSHTTNDSIFLLGNTKCCSKTFPVGSRLAN